MQKLISTPDPDIAAGRPRGRPRAFDRQAALAKATRLFWEKGYEATSIADLTEAMGIGAPSLYAAFGSKDALYAEALNHYAETNGALVWGRFAAAGSAREAVQALLMDSAAALTGAVVDIPRGCMVTLSSVGAEGHAALGKLVREGRATTLERLMARFERALADGELPPATDLHALARFVQTVQAGMSILARDGASAAELTQVAQLAMLGWDARLGDDLARQAAGIDDGEAMKVRRFTIADAAMERSPGQDADIFAGNLVDERDGGPITIGYGRYGPDQSLTEVLAVDDVMIVLEGRLSVSTAAGTVTTGPGEIVHMPKGERVTIRAHEAGAVTAYVTYPHWRTAQA